MELRTFVIPRKIPRRDDIQQVIVELVVKKEEDGKILFDYNRELAIDVLLCKQENVLDCKPSPISHVHFNPHNDLPEPLNPEEESFLKENECSIAQFNLNRKFKLTVDMNVPLTAARIFARIISKHIKHQIDEYLKGIYSYTLLIENPSPLEKE